MRGSEGIAAAAVAGRRRRRVLHDRRGRRDLRLLLRIGLLRGRLLIAGLRLLVAALLRIRRRLPVAGIGLRGCGGHVRLGWRRCGRCWWRGAKLTQPLFELPVAILQFLVLAGDLPELVLQPLDAQFEVGILGKSLRGKSEHRSSGRGERKRVKSG